MRWQERLVMWVAWHLPKEVVKWACVRVAVHEEQGNPGDVTMSYALNRWQGGAP